VKIWEDWNLLLANIIIILLLLSLFIAVFQDMGD